jgi:hypothetical protein
MMKMVDRVMMPSRDFQKRAWCLCGDPRST